MSRPGKAVRNMPVIANMHRDCEAQIDWPVGARPGGAAHERRVAGDTGQFGWRPILSNYFL
jgi:uncharacterized protein YlaI